ncbi:hypothetical protein FB45DRAFT_148278 [Roridomyces roridus]|uniref:Uncharacterized protein n=1 Tax=Roridomyces roridus TaxID=1738132 RepID=A0AAD7BGV7_9AGAR|nr:hypothetical protein FB45DRAFT_148278 [Roridomyces roridus]
MADEQPVFPPELERHIFEICALGRPVLAPKLMLVAWRVKQWIEPLLYRTIVLGEPSACREGYPSFTLESLLSTIRAKPPGFLAGAVRNLSLNPSTAGYEEILSACTAGLQNLRIFSIDSAISGAHALSTLKQLYVFDFPHHLPDSVFAQLTHLDVMGCPPDTFEKGDGLDIFYTSVLQMQRLTHISFSDDGYTPIFLRLLRGCAQIQVLFYYDACKDDNASLLSQESLVEDPRFVVLRFKDLPEIWNWVDDWHTGVHCGRDYWYRAEQFVRQRRSGEIDRRQCLMSSEAWMSCA